MLHRRCVFVWENLGPMHEDRIGAVARARPGLVRAVQFWPRSDTYGWEPSVHAVPTRTLLPAPGARLGLRFAWRLFRACRAEHGGDVYLCHYERWPVLVAALLLRLSGARVFAMIESKFDDYPRRLWREVAKSLFVRPYSGAFVGTQRSRDYVRFLGFGGRRPVALGYDSLSVARIRAQAPAPPAPAGAPHAARDFLVVARLVPKKNLSLAIAAFAQARADGGSRRTLRILGSGPCEPALRQQAEALGVADHIVFEGFVQTMRISQALANALCLILPSHEEQFGLVVIEAMAMGVPALVSANAGAVDLMIDNGINGWVIDPRDPRTLAAAMARLDRDAAAWAAMARAAAADSHRGDSAIFAQGVDALSGHAAKG